MAHTKMKVFFVTALLIASVAATDRVQVFENGSYKFCKNGYNCVTSESPVDSANYTEDTSQATFEALQVSVVNPRWFPYQNTIRSVIFSDGFLFALKASDFANIQFATEITMISCQITAFEVDVFNASSNVLDIDMSHNSIIELNRLGHFARLKILKLHNNLIKVIEPNVFASYPNLRELHLQNNKISRVYETSFGGLDLLEKLYLQNNKLLTLVRFPDMPSLEQLHIDVNKIRQIKNETFSGCLVLENLDLSNNKIKFIEKGAFHGLEHLETLDLKNNRLSVVPPFDELPSLETLLLSINSIYSIAPRAFAGMDSLRKLDLQNNQLTSLDVASFDGLSSTIEELNLYSNGLTFISHGLLNRISSSDFYCKFTIRDNPWSCHCLDIIKERLAGKLPEYLNGYEVRCIQAADKTCDVTNNISAITAQ